MIPHFQDVDKPLPHADTIPNVDRNSTSLIWEFSWNSLKLTKF